MKLIYLATDLATLGELRILGRSTRREPVESPQRERVEYRVRLDFFQSSFQANFGLLQQFAAALQSDQAQLQWTDDGGTTYENRPVTAGDSTMPADVLLKGGTHWQAVEFSFWYWNHNLTTSSLNGTFTRSGSAAQDLGAIETWSERTVFERVDPLRDVRRSGVCTLTASGRWQADTTLPVAQRQAALQAKKDTLTTEMLLTGKGTLVYGTLNQVVRVTEFTAAVNQPSNYLGWQLTVTFTRYPDEANYSLVELRVQRRENLAEGIQRLVLTGRVHAPTEAAANARLTALAAAIVPAGYATLGTEITPTIHQSNSDSGGDGETFTEINYTLEYRDTSGIALTYQRPVANAPAVDLGTVDGFSDKNSTTLFDEMRSVRKRAAGGVSFSGKWYAADALSDTAKRAQLLGQLATLKTELAKGASGTLVYGTAFNQVVRVLDFDPHLNRLRNCIEWTLSASYTQYPNEADYALADLQLGTRENQTEGTVIKTLTGRIAAQSPEAARSKLARLRTALIPAGYLLQSNSDEERRVSSESNRTTPALPQGDGDAFIELTVNDVWQKTAGGSVLEWTLRTITDKDVKSTTVRRSFTGTVRAAAATQPAAFAAAAAQADTLGNNKYPLLFRSSLTVLDRLFQTTGGQIFVNVEFTYDYETQNDTSYLEVTSTRSTDNYGVDTESVSGYVAAPSVAAAEAVYQANVRSLPLFAGALVVSERKPTLNQATILGAGTLEQRYDFSLQLLRPKAVGTNSLRYDLSVSPDFRTNELITTMSGTVWGATQAEAEAFLQSAITGLGLTGVLMGNPRTPHFRKGPGVGGSAAVDLFESMDFSVTYVSLFTGAAGILETEVNEDLVYSGQRNIERPIPDGPSIIQQAGTTCGIRTVTVRCRATTKAAADAYVRGIRSALLLSLNGGSAVAFEDPPRLGARYVALPRTALVVAGAGANAVAYEVSGTFSERIPELAFS